MVGCCCSEETGILIDILYADFSPTEKKQWGGLSEGWVVPEVRAEVVTFVGYWQQRGPFKVGPLLGWLGLGSSTYYSWPARQGQANQPNGQVPKGHWLLAWEQAAIESYARAHPGEGYRRLSFMMLDEDVVAVSPSSAYRVLQAAGLLQPWERKASRKGQGFDQPTCAHQHWHIDIAYLNLGGIFYYLCSVLDGYSRYVVHWEIREQMTETEVQLILQRAPEKFPTARPRIISDNGPQFIAHEFKRFIQACGMTHVRTSPNYPQSNGKLERWHKTVKGEAIRPHTPLTLEQARRVVDQFVRYYNEVRLHCASGYVTPKARLTGQDQPIQAQRQRKLAQARERRQQQHHAELATNEFNSSVQLVIPEPQIPFSAEPVQGIFLAA
jgi:transposase InsO family protein